jgi:hypothetical protein
VRFAGGETAGEAEWWRREDVPAAVFSAAGNQRACGLTGRTEATRLRMEVPHEVRLGTAPHTVEHVDLEAALDAE